MGWFAWLKRWWEERNRPLTANERGRLAEREAALYLRRRGYRIIAQNLRSKLGEIDLVAVKRDVVVFVEVKARSSDEFGTPNEALTLRQQKRIQSAAETFAARRGWLDRNLRFDLIAVDLDKWGRVVKIEHIQNAF